MKLFYCDQIEPALAPGSKFPMEKYRLLRERLSGLPGQYYTLIESPPVSIDTLLHVHTREYIDAILAGSLSKQAQRRIGFPWSTQLVARSLRSVGGTVAACQAAQTDGVGVNLAGGTHHAKSNAGAGYCIFNDLAVAARQLTANSKTVRVLIVDADVHQGDGTAEILRHDDRIFTYSIHCMDNFPSQKLISDLDVPLMAGTGDSQYLTQFEDGLKRALLSARADFVFYLAGADPFEGDRLGRLNLTKNALAARDQLIVDACRRSFLPLAVVMGGGYAKDVEDIVDIHVETIQIVKALERELAVDA